MEENQVSKLIKMAKGDDRSLREYSRASGIDATVISRIIHGIYTPQKLDIYKKLTSENAAPRNDVTFERLIEAISGTPKIKDDSFNMGLEEGKAIAAKVLSLIGDYSYNKINTATEREKARNAKINQLKEINKKTSELQKYAAMANGILLGKISSYGLSIKSIKPNNSEILGNRFDTLVQLSDSRITEYIIRYMYLSKNEIDDNFLIENTPKRLIEELMFLPKNSKRKVSIIMNSPKAYEFILKYKYKLAYNGDLSIMLFDTKKIDITQEDYIAYYNDCNENEFIIN